MHEARAFHGVRTLQLGWLFLRIGALACSGLSTVEALLERELVVQRDAIFPFDLATARVYASRFPGMPSIHTISYLGYTLGGWPGATLAIVSFLCPTVLIMLLLAVLFVALATLPALGPVVEGGTAAVACVLCTVIYRLGTAAITEPLTLKVAWSPARRA
jgi:chromate transporter